LLWGQWLPFVAAAPPTVYDFRFVQGTAALPTVKIYLDIIGSGDVPAKGLQKEDFTATVGNAPTKISRLVPFEDAKEGVGFILLVDISKSLSRDQFVQMKSTLVAFVDSMSELDRVALISFGQGVKVIQDFTANRSKIKDQIAGLTPTDEETAFYGGIDKAVNLARAGGADVPARRVVITLTDGVNDLTGGVSKGDIAERLKADPVPLYLIGFVQGKPSAEEESAIGVMKTFSRLSGGRYYDGRGGEWRGIYFAISRAIRSAFLLETEVTNFRSEGAVYPVSVSLIAANRTWTEKMELTIPAGGALTPAQVPSPTTAASSGQRTDTLSDPMNLWMVFGAVVIALLAAGWFFVRRRRLGKSSIAVVSAPPNRAFPPESEMLGAASIPTEPAPGVLIRLTRIDAGASTNQFELEIADRVVIGSDPLVSHLVFDQDEGIAAAHCEIFFEAGYLFLRDLSSATGTLLNGMPLADQRRIEDQDVLRIGQTEMRITFPN
jgi:Mg-chelatase subunit ChlD